MSRLTCQGFWQVAEEKVKFRGIFRDKFEEKSADFVVILAEFLEQLKLHQKAVDKKQPILWLFSRQFRYQLCADQMRPAFLTFFYKQRSPFALSTTTHSRNEVPGSFRMLFHVSVTKFWDKCASLRQINSPSSWSKFQICFWWHARCILMALEVQSFFI